MFRPLAGFSGEVLMCLPLGQSINDSARVWAEGENVYLGLAVAAHACPITAEPDTRRLKQSLSGPQNSGLSQSQNKQDHIVKLCLRLSLSLSICLTSPLSSNVSEFLHQLVMCLLLLKLRKTIERRGNWRDRFTLRKTGMVTL